MGISVNVAVIEPSLVGFATWQVSPVVHPVHVPVPVVTQVGLFQPLYLVAVTVNVPLVATGFIPYELLLLAPVTDNVPPKDTCETVIL